MFRPDSAFIVLTTDCNRRDSCAYCFYNVEPERLAETRLTREAVVGLLKKLRLTGTGAVFFTGGEPLLRADINALVFKANEMGMAALLLSNGSLLTTESLGALEKAGLDTFILSLPAADLLDKRIISTAAQFRRAALSLICVITQKNFNRMPSVWEAAQALRAGIIFQPAYIPDGHALERELSLKHLNPFDWSFLYAALRPWARAAGLETYWKFVYDFYNERRMKLPHCCFVENAFVVDADGTAYSCFHRRDLPCGNVLDDDFSHIVRRLQNCYKDLIGGACFGEHCISAQTAMGKQ